MVSDEFTAQKLHQLVELSGYDNQDEALEDWVFDSVASGICMNDDCDYITTVEPDCDSGHCELCNTQTVQSGLVVANII